ncbi:hypothetical protein PIROE2DRAFT_6536 [Piromyces sp. E2]|nr:hypothetical protein PIROE2DRAFT_6536 [Piromyces sp. E2]|eukprot:OUM66298.1 hypothetical protein PIROE2DRAFT_6536 [Piromyces sp. E2]
MGNHWRPYDDVYNIINIEMYLNLINAKYHEWFNKPDLKLSTKCNNKKIYIFRNGIVNLNKDC